jgi:serine/threonine protein kinase
LNLCVKIVQHPSDYYTIEILPAKQAAEKPMEDITGKQLGPYQIIAPLGEGGMAAVYKAYQPGVEREVALKILPRHFANDPQFVARFEQEAKMLAQLQHPHILPVFDFGEAEGYTYIVMPLLKSGDLNDLMKVKPLPLDQIRRITTQVGDALEYAHQRGVVHRDVKPSNVLLDESGNCLLTDFGIAKLVESSANITATGGIVGTPTYMSPEQGLGRKLDGRSDIYSLGIIMYEMATGRVPYRAETPMAVVVKHINDPLPPPRQVNANIPKQLEKVILKAVVKKPDDRYQSAAELVKAAKKAIPEGGSIAPATMLTPSPPTLETPEVEETEKKSSKKMVWGVVIAAVLLVGLGLLVMASAGAMFIFGSSSGREEVTRVAEITVTVPLVETATPTQPISTESPTTPTNPIEVPEAATTSPSTATPTPLPVLLDAEAGLACIGTFGLGISCLNEGDIWRTYTEENSPLGSNLVYALAACPDGRIAVAHAFGISMFDGQNWTEYESAPGATSPSALACDAYGGLWMTHYSAASYFDGTNWTTHTSDKFAANADPKALVDSIAISSSGDVWLSTSNSIARFDGREWEVFQAGDGFDDRYFFDEVVIDSWDRPWALHGGGVFAYNGEQWTEHKNRDLTVSKSIAVDSNDEVWVGTYSKGIRIFNGQGGWRTLDPQNSDLTSNRVELITADRGGRMWLATDWGLNIVDGENWQAYHMHNADLVANNIRAIAVAGLGPTLPELIEKNPGTLTGRMVTREGEPVVNAAVEMCVTHINIDRFSGASPCAEHPYMLQTTTDADGSFVVTNVPGGYYQLVVNDPQAGWVILDEKTSSLEDERVLLEPGQETNLLQVIVTPGE